MRSGEGEFGASPKNSPLPSGVSARVLGLSQKVTWVTISPLACHYNIRSMNSDGWHSRLLFPALLVCFLLSGATALVYEVLWVRMLILRLGSTSLAISTVVTAFMAGLAFGAWAAGRYSSRITRPLAAHILAKNRM